MRRRTLILYLLLLVVPAGVIGVLAIRWIRQEGDRLQVLGRQALEEQAAVMAGNLEFLLRDVTDGVMDALHRLPADDPEALYRWRARHPLVRNVFVWTAGGRLRLPDARWPDIEEQTFLQRYDALFGGRRAWPDAADETDGPTVPPASAPAVRRARSEAVSRHAMADPATHDRRVAGTAGWLPWFWEHDLHLLGWIRGDNGSTVRGAELEFMAVLARFQTLFGSDSGRLAAFALSDHHGAILMRTAGFDEARRAVSGSSAQAVGELLPNWHVHAVALQPRPAGGVSFALLAGLLAGTLLIAILSGGALLLWQAGRDYRDALRKTTFVSNVSHELKTPLTTIRMYAEMLAQDRVRDDAKRRAYVGVIAAESARLTRLVNNVLDFSRLEQSRKTYRREPIDLTAWLRDAIAAHRDRIEAAGMRIDPLIPEHPVIVSGDRDALDQVLLNLLDNAIKYAAAGGGVSIAIEADAAGIRITVADRGGGIPRERAERVFDSFYRVDDSLTTRVPGSGLGLSIGRRLMRDLGGDLLYRPRDGGGAVFEMRLPKEKTDA